jgi:RimJ/RimL family protein N-acetyltransferase
VIELVPCTVDVARAVLAGDDPGIPHALDWPHADTADALRPLAEHPAYTGPGTFLVVRDGVVVGDVGWFGPPDDQGEVEIGYGLAPSARGQGIGTQAVGMLLAWVAERGAVRVRAEVEPGNAASFRLLERLGFTLVGERAGHVVLVRDAGHGDPGLPARESAG